MTALRAGWVGGGIGVYVEREEGIESSRQERNEEEEELTWQRSYTRLMKRIHVGSFKGCNGSKCKNESTIRQTGRIGHWETGSGENKRRQNPAGSQPC